MQGLTYIILIGIEEYHEHADFPKVDYAKKDVYDISNALKLLGYDEEDFIILLDDKATKSSIIQKIKKTTERVVENDRIIFYFSGHGFYENGCNLLAPVDAMKTAKFETCVSLETILGFFNKSICKQIILFLDCCHSGFKAGEGIRAAEDSFMADELIFQFRSEQYCVGFASCQSNEKSLSLATLKNGVWSHFLIKALSGNADGIYTKGLLFSDKLQAYLNKETSQYVKMNTVDKKDQTPIKFGSETDKFIIADINPIIEERLKKKDKNEFAVENVSLYSWSSSSVKSLPGFIKGSHKVPTYIGGSANSFIQDKGYSIIEDEITHLSKELQLKLKYKRTDMRSGIDKGAGSIETKDFDYSIAISQSETSPDEYLKIRRLEFIKNKEILINSEFNLIFARYFDNLVFNVYKEIDIMLLIDKIEALDDDAPISVQYNSAKLNECIIKIKDLDYSIEVSPDSISITTEYLTSPSKLIEAFSETRKTILAYPELRLINGL